MLNILRYITKLHNSILDSKHATQDPKIGLRTIKATVLESVFRGEYSEEEICPIYMRRGLENTKM